MYILVLIYLLAIMLGILFFIFYKKQILSKKKQLFIWIKPDKENHIKILNISQKSDIKREIEEFIQMQKRLDESNYARNSIDLDKIVKHNFQLPYLFNAFDFYGIIEYHTKIKNKKKKYFQIMLKRKINDNILKQIENNNSNISPDKFYSTLNKTYIEAELMVTGFKILNDKIQRFKLKEKELKFKWKCSFNVPGNFMSSIKFYLTDSDQKLNLGEFEQNIEVIR